MTKPILPHNMRVKYESTNTPGRWFQGRVFNGWDAKKIVVRHDTEPKLVAVNIFRLRADPPPTFRGRRGNIA